MALIGIRGPNSPLATNHVVTLYNPIQLAAISNYKLAQLTFAPPDLDSLRKTAVIKNMLGDIYTSTPSEWLQQMTRWEYFTPESLDDMTQEDLEEIFAQYAQKIEAFRPVESLNPFDDDTGFLKENYGQDDDLWIAQKAQELPLPPINIPVFLQEQTDQDQDQKMNSDESISSAIFSQPNASISSESINQQVIPTSSNKPLPSGAINEPKRTSDLPQIKRLSGISNNTAAKNKDRMSWKSDTGIVSNAVSQNLANELMNLFDMDFALDIKLNTAPKLPELSFKHKRRSQQRQSQDMLATLLPEFEKIALQNSVTPKPTLMIRSVPKRSSSLRNRQESENAKIHPPPVLEPPKQKTILRLASWMTSKNHKEPPVTNFEKKLPSSPDLNGETSSSTLQETRISTAVSVKSASSSWSLLSENGNMRIQKPLPAAPEMKRRRSKKKQNSLMKSKSESTFLKIGLKKKQLRRSESAKDLSTEQQPVVETDLPYHTSAEVNQHKAERGGFVRKMTLFMKPRHKSVKV